MKALLRQDGRKIEANFGLDPRLGKYYRTFCASCDSILDESLAVVDRCSYCGSTKIVRGVMDRITEISDLTTPLWPAYRPPYHYQVPLEFIPGLGKKKMDQLLQRFGTEMNIIHHVAADLLTEAVGQEISDMIIRARNGKLLLYAGGGGQYGKVARGS